MYFKMSINLRFLNAVYEKDIKSVKFFLLNTNLYPEIHDNYAICHAYKNRQYHMVSLLFKNKRIQDSLKNKPEIYKIINTKIQEKFQEKISLF